jgi:CRISPR-associated protein Cmr6
MRRAIVQLRNRRQSGQHPGLLLQRYLCSPATGQLGDPQERRALLLAAIQAAQDQQVRQLYQTAFQRWKTALSRSALTTEVQTHGRLIVGLGSENVLETGITLHHTYGMPYIPGSALKGLAAHYCHQVWGASEARFRLPPPEEEKQYREYLADPTKPKPPDNFHRLLFGTTDDSGCVVFHDAWFIPDSDPQPLRLDVMTPHHLRWLDGSVAPTDFDSPTPVPFLSVCGRFLLALSWRGPDCPQARQWIELAMQLLRDALEHWGVGGKTSSGYGRLMKASS